MHTRKCQIKDVCMTEINCSCSTEFVCSFLQKRHSALHAVVENGSKKLYRNQIANQMKCYWFNKYVIEIEGMSEEWVHCMYIVHVPMCDVECVRTTHSICSSQCAALGHAQLWAFRKTTALSTYKHLPQLDPFNEGNWNFELRSGDSRWRITACRERPNTFNSQHRNSTHLTLEKCFCYMLNSSRESSLLQFIIFVNFYEEKSNNHLNMYVTL